MKREFLQGFKLEKEDIDQIMAEYGKGIERFKQQVIDLTGERDSLKAQVDGVAETLKAFEGVDVAALQGEIGKLKNDLAQKDTDYTAKLAERDFTATLNEAILTAKGRNTKAIIAALGDVETLKASKNQKEDIAAALKTLRESDAYLFDENKNSTNPFTLAKVSSGGVHDENGDGSSSSTNQTMNALFRGGEPKGD
jgi:hypothetical protein